MKLTRERHVVMGRGGSYAKLLRRPVAVMNQFQDLYTVRFRHDFYNVDDGRCPDFYVVPTPTTADAMQSYGLLLKDFGTGFTVCCSTQSANVLSGFLATEQASGADLLGNWRRLSFAVVCRNPGFVGITRIPLDFNPPVSNFYFSNITAHQDMSGAILLAPERFVSRKQIRPVIPQSFDMTSAPNLVCVNAYDISGERAFSVNGPMGSPPGSDTLLSIDFVGYADGVYQLEEVFSDAPSVWGAPLLRNISSPLPMCFIDLFYCRPPGIDSGVYAVTLDGAKASVRAVDMELRFAARKTIWTYYVVSQSSEGQLVGLSIQGEGAQFHQKASVILPTGAIAIPFEADRPLALRQKSEYVFSLTGQRVGRFSSNAISVPHLPVAGQYPIWPDREIEGGRSDIYVYV